MTRSSQKGSPLRILHVVHGLPPESRGGTEQYVLQAARALAKRGHGVSILSGSMQPADEPRLEDTSRDGLPVTILRRSGFFIDRWESSFDPAAAQLFARHLEKSKPDVVHVHQWIRLTRNLVELCAAHGVPAVVTLHDAMTSCPRAFRVRDETSCERELSAASCVSCVERPGWMDDAETAAEVEAFAADFRSELELASAVIVPSRAHQAFMARHLGKAPDFFDVVPHGTLAPARRGPGPAARPPAQPILIAHWGHLAPLKGYHLLLEALQRLPQEVRGRFRVIVWGTASDPDYRRRLDALSAGLDVTELGAFSPADIGRRRFDLAVIPSIASESFSFVLDEAFHAGAPVLVPDRGALAERLGGAGATFSAESPQALADVLASVAADPGILGVWRQAIPKLLTMSAHARALEDVYREAITAPGKKPPPNREAERLARLGDRLVARTRALEAARAEAEGEAARANQTQLHFDRAGTTIATLRHELAEAQRALEQRDREAARLQEVVGRTLGERELAEKVWKDSMDGLLRSVELHATAVADAERRLQDLAVQTRTAQSAARESELEIATLERELEAARGERSAAQDRILRLDTAIAEDRRAIESWRDRALRAQALVAELEAGLADTTQRHGREIGTLQARLEEAQRIESELHAAGTILQGIEKELGASEIEPASLPLRVAKLARIAADQRSHLDEVRSAARGKGLARHGAELVRRLDSLPRRLRILMVIHDFLPYHAAGSEIYTYQLGKELSKRHDVELVFTHNRPERPQYEATRGFYDGLPYTEIVHHDAYPTFRSTYVDRGMEAAFDRVLDRFRPDIVHLQHTKFFGVGIISRAKRRGTPVVFTLHEYMLLCARDGQMLQPTLERCTVPKIDVCAECVAPRLVPEGLLRAGTAVAGRALTHVLPAPLKAAGTKIARRAARGSPVAADPHSRQKLLAERERTIRSALGQVDLFLAPSEFLRETFLRSGAVSPDRIVLSRYGQDLTRFHAKERSRSRNLRVGYLGTIAAYKGVHLLVDALNRLSAFPVEGRIHGALEIFPEFVAVLRSRIQNPRITLFGRYDNKDVGRLLSEMDVLVVPSLWWENSPITIHEAFLSQTPVVVSDQGGMAELVQEGVNGFHFRIGDAADLSRVLLRLVTEPALLDRARPKASGIRDIREDAVWTESRYRQLLVRRATP